MKFSEVIGEAYHRINLPESNQFRLDCYFSAAAHHLQRYKEAKNGSEAEDFHDKLFRRHLYALMNLIGGNFTKAQDPTGLNLQLRRNWNPEISKIQLPDPSMFNAMKADDRFSEGEAHITDSYLRDVDMKNENSQRYG